MGDPVNARVLIGRVKILGNMLNFNGHIREDIAHFKSQKYLLSVLFRMHLCDSPGPFALSPTLIPSPPLGSVSGT